MRPGKRNKPGPILILSAFAPELAELRRLLANEDRAFRAAVTCEPAGIGLPDAAVGAARAIERLRPDEVLFVGTAGSYQAAPAIGTVAITRGLHLASAARARGQGYLPPPLVDRADADADIRKRLQRAASAVGVRGQLVDAATPLAITTSPALARAHVRATATAVENLEAFGVARAAAIAGVPFGAVLGISNRVGPRAHEQWRRHQDAAMSAVAVVVLHYLRARSTAPSR